MPIFMQKKKKKERNLTRTHTHNTSRTVQAPTHTHSSSNFILESLNHKHIKPPLPALQPIEKSTPR